MRTKQRVGFLLVGFLFFANFAPADPQQPSQEFYPIIHLTGNLGILQQTLQQQASSVYREVSGLMDHPGGFPEGVVQARVGELIQFSALLPDTLANLDHQMNDLHNLILQKRIVYLDSKFNSWGMEYGGVLTDSYDLLDFTDTLRKENVMQDTAQKLEKPAKLLKEIAKELAELHVRFQVVANLIEIFRQAGFKIVKPPERILGENWLQHEMRTREWGIADPMKPTKIFRSHSIYAIRDHNPEHQVWACEATIMDFLQGTVKGQEYPYKNSVGVPFCYRCHAARKGTHNFPWCVYGNSHEMEQACIIIEATAGKK